MPEHKLMIKSEDCSSTSTLCLKFHGKFLPPAVFHKIVAMCISKWPLAEEEGNPIIYSGLCRFLLDKTKTIQLTLYMVDYVIHAYIESFDQNIKSVSNVCCTVRSFLVHQCEVVLKTMGLSLDFDVCIKCLVVAPTVVQGYVEFDLLQQLGTIRCDAHCPSHNLKSEELLSCWYEDSKVRKKLNSPTGLPFHP